MRRRTLLTGLGTSLISLLAGCNAPADRTTVPTEPPNNPQTESPTTSPTHTEASTYKPRYHVGSLTVDDGSAPFSYTANRVTNAGEPLAFDIIITNTSNETIWVGDVQDVFFEKHKPENNDVYQLFPKISESSFEKADFCWKATTQYDQDNSFQAIKIEPGNHQKRRVYLAAHTDATCSYKKPTSLTFRANIQYSNTQHQQPRTTTTVEFVLFYLEEIK